MLGRQSPPDGPGRRGAVDGPCRRHAVRCDNATSATGARVVRRISDLRNEIVPSLARVGLDSVDGREDPPPRQLHNPLNLPGVGADLLPILDHSNDRQARTGPPGNLQAPRHAVDLPPVGSRRGSASHLSGQAPPLVVEPDPPASWPRSHSAVQDVTVTQVLVSGSYLTALTVDTCATVTIMRRLPVQEAAQEVGVSRQTVHRYIRLGYLKAYRAPGVDRRTYVDVDELRELRRNPPFTELDRRDS
jgi:Helix-turn-helix domain